MDATAPILTKSDFLEARKCPKGFRSALRHPDLFPSPRPTSYDLMLMEEGKAAHASARVWLSQTAAGGELEFEVPFESSCGLHARADAVRRNADGSIDLIEIKASTRPEEHLVDLVFQAIVARRCGIRVGLCLIAHLDAGYRSGGQEGASPFLLRDLTEEVATAEAAVAQEVDDVRALLDAAVIDEKGCECRYKGNVSDRCAAFANLNPDITEPSVHLLPRISGSRLRKLDAEGRLDLRLVTEKDLTAGQLPHLDALRSGTPVIRRERLGRFLDELEWPVHLYDYETHGRAIPRAVGHRPYMQVPVQFSMHLLERSGAVEHHEFLASGEGEERALVTALRQATRDAGTFLAWNMGFEKGRNRVLADLVPEDADFLESVNDRTRDLMVPFKMDYVHPLFAGSASIKKVLPVVCPHLSYDPNAVHDGAGAMAAWREMAASADEGRRASLSRELLAYCELDTLAMLEILKFLMRTVDGSA